MNDLDAYEILVQEHEDMLGAYVRGIVGDAATTEDIVQKAFVRAYHNASSFRKGTSFAAWIRTIARNLAIDELRRRRKETAWDPEFIQGMEDIFRPFDDVAAKASWEERLRQVEHCYDTLPAELREPCRLFYYEDAAAGWIAQRLNLQPETVWKRLERARQAIRACFEQALGLEAVPIS